MGLYVAAIVFVKKKVRKLQKMSDRERFFGVASCKRAAIAHQIKKEETRNEYIL